jgi:hypothetical protein
LAKGISERCSKPWSKIKWKEGYFDHGQMDKLSSH